MKYNALHAPCDAKDNIDIRDSNLQRQKTGGCTSSRAFGSQGVSVAFCLKVCDVLAQHDEFSAILRSRLLVCKSAMNVTRLEFLEFFQVTLNSCFNKLAFEVEFLPDFRE